jgi:hypothetical protein
MYLLCFATIGVTAMKQDMSILPAAVMALIAYAFLGWFAWYIPDSEFALIPLEFWSMLPLQFFNASLYAFMHLIAQSTGACASQN